MADFKFENKVLYNGLLFVFFLLLSFMVYQVVKFFIPALLVALFIVYITRPVYTQLEHLTERTYLSSLLTMFMFSALLLGVVGLLGFTFVNEYSNIASSSVVQEFVVPQFGELPELTTPSISRDVLYQMRSDITSIPAYTQKAQTAFELAGGILLAAGNFILQSFFGIFMGYYLIRHRRDVRKYFMSAMPAEQRHIIEDIVDEIDISFNHLFFGIFMTAMFAASVTYAIYYFFGIPYPAILSLVVGILALIPVIGAWLVYAPLTAYLFLIRPDPIVAIYFLFANIALISFAPDWIFRPFVVVQDKKMNLLLIFIGFIGGGLAYGALGLFIGPMILSTFLSFVYVFKKYEEKKVAPKTKIKEAKTSPRRRRKG